jgi:arsenite methyltransferase
VRDAQLQPGEVVLELGYGSGIDLLLAAPQVEPTGKVIGLDLAPERNGMSGEGPSGRSRALEILGERYVKGELTKEQYEQMRQDITK